MLFRWKFAETEKLISIMIESTLSGSGSSPEFNNHVIEELKKQVDFLCKERVRLIRENEEKDEALANMFSYIQGLRLPKSGNPSSGQS
jgi:hypothetical protein